MNKLYFFLFFSLNVVATPQIPDILIYKGIKYEWNDYNPGHDYLNNIGFRVPSDAIETTANTGYYILTYEIENDSLFLIDVVILIEDLTTRSVFEEFFDNKRKIFMKSFSNICLIGNGETLESAKQGLSFVPHKRYLLFEFNSGILNNNFDFSNRQLNRFKRKLFNKFRKTDDYEIEKEKELAILEKINTSSFIKISIDQYLETNVLRFVKTLKL
jgi:hypothetical protein